MKKTTHSPLETQALAQQIGLLSYPGLVILLSGDLGAGKTTFTQGLAKGLNIERTVSSPTFTLMKNYKGRLTLNHIDAYRLENIEQDLGFEEMINGHGVTVIEWPNFIQHLWPEHYLLIEFEQGEDTIRSLTISAVGLLENQLLEKLK